MTKPEKPVLFLGILKKRSVILDALQEAEKLLNSVAYVTKDGDTKEPLRLLRLAIKEITGTR